MTGRDAVQAMVGWHYLLVKRGLYYAPDRQGYTGLKRFAGRYREVDALGLDGVEAIHEDEAPEYSEACWPETKLRDKDDRITAQQAEIARLRIALHEIDVEAANTIPPDGLDAAHQCLFRITQIINPFRPKRAALEGQKP